MRDGLAPFSLLIRDMFFRELGHQFVNIIGWPDLEIVIDYRMTYLMGQYVEICIIH